MNKYWMSGLGLMLFSGAVAAAPLQVVSSFSILGDVVKQVGGDRVAVTNLVGANQDSHAYNMTAADVKTMRDAGINAFLVGEAFMRADDPGLALAKLFA